MRALTALSNFQYHSKIGPDPVAVLGGQEDPDPRPRAFDNPEGAPYLKQVERNYKKKCKHTR